MHADGVCLLVAYPRGSEASSACAPACVAEWGVWAHVRASVACASCCPARPSCCFIRAMLPHVRVILPPHVAACTCAKGGSHGWHILSMDLLAVYLPLGLFLGFTCDLVAQPLLNQKIEGVLEFLGPTSCNWFQRQLNLVSYLPKSNPYTGGLSLLRRNGK